jgi:3-deoxy-D-manno-octulosonate 8-phosphate phosphatase (KDO 8-P phosphatase)
MRQLSSKLVDPGSIRLLVTDLDGIWTDGGILVDETGMETVRFSALDGLAVQLARQGGIKIAILTARRCPAVFYRMTRLGVDEVRQGSKDKAADFADLCRQLDVPLDQTAYMGDDLTDLGPLRAAAVGITVPQAPTEVRQGADFQTDHPGGAGAVREAVEWLLQENGRWEEILASFDPAAGPPPGRS